MKTNNLATLKERLISAWCCLTYKEFFMCACERNENGTIKNAEKFIEENKQCDILSNETIADLDSKWMDSWKTLVDVKLLW